VPSSYPIIRRRLPSLSSAFTYAPLIVNCTGLGSLSLPDVLDTRMYPGMGQTITVRAPLATSYISCKDPRADGAHSVGEQIYIIPRPASGGLVTLGGCFLADDWDTTPCPQRAERILREAYVLCPDLAAGAAGAAGGEDGWRSIEVVSHNVGLRPCRRGGLRLELEHRKTAAGASASALVPGTALSAAREVGCVHAYGVGSAGYQMSLAIAEEAAELALGFLAKRSGDTRAKAKL
jgi:hypothetical protein